MSFRASRPLGIPVMVETSFHIRSRSTTWGRPSMDTLEFYRRRA